MAEFEKARDLLRTFKGDWYVHGRYSGVPARRRPPWDGRRLWCDLRLPAASFLRTIREALDVAGVSLLGEISGPAPNAPTEDLVRVAAALESLDPDVVISFGGGSTIDVAKAATVLHALGDDIEPYFGTGLVSAALSTLERSSSRTSQSRRRPVLRRA